MEIKTFKVEQWMDAYENDAVYNLAETCIDSLTVGELLDLAGIDRKSFWDSVCDTRLTYSNIYGSPALLRGIASLYQALPPDHAVPMHGAIAANNSAYKALVKPGCSTVTALPTYQQHSSIPEALGADVRVLQLRKENGYLPDLNELRALVDDTTAVISLNNPNNPTGALISPDLLREIADIAASVDAYVLVDEVYRGITPDGSYAPSIIDFYEKGVSVGSMSKVFSLAGLRLGWVATRDTALIDAIKEHRDYDTISCPVLDDLLAAIALTNKDAILARNRGIVLRNREILCDWVARTQGVSFVPPAAGTTALLEFDLDMDSYDFCKELLDATGVFLTPGGAFDLTGCTARIGYAFDSRELRTGLDRLAAFLTTKLPR